MTYASKMAREAVGKHFAGKTLDAYAGPVEAAILAVIERCAQEAETATGDSTEYGQMQTAGAILSGTRIRALASEPQR